jgi:hypothetical protein
MDGRFAKIDDRFAKIDDRFDKVDDRLDSLRSEMDERFRNSDARLHEVEMRVFEQEKHFVVLRGQMDSLASTLRAELHRELRVHLLALAGLGVTATGIILGAM